MFEYDDNTKQDISVAAYLLAQKKLPFDDLCWMLADRQLYLQNNFQKANENAIKAQAIKIFGSQPSYDVLCWLISEIDFVLKMQKYQGMKKPHFILD
jgi:hypothetical protein